ncbi:hypothetical protein A165_16350 [Vibrio tasmaniensis ZS-17]|uniref:hypothetical protein n=1 Tax=Vibrio tasmaniensis TaxID=212663 RepID=UPI0003628819|nr:hypothetical protein [Vibrio tasmaniensis]OED61049.1 hypothetical protein A165_16350 [Vibrio tasmaniensis ZS-17]
MTEANENLPQQTPQRSLSLLNSCIDGLQISIDMVSKAAAVSTTYSYLKAEKGFDYKLHEESFGCAKYIMDQLHELIDAIPGDENAKKTREKNRIKLTPLDFVEGELKKTLSGMITSKNQLEASISMYEALSQLNLDEGGYRYKFAIEERIVDLMNISDSITEFLTPVIVKAFKIRRSRINKLKQAVE